MKDGKALTFLSVLEEEINDKNPNLVLCVIPSARGDLYSLIKRKLCVDRAGNENVNELYILLDHSKVILTIFITLLETL